MIRLNDIIKTYGKGNIAVEALRGINLNISQGEIVAIMGRSGCGKSTLLNILGGIDSPNSGNYLFQEKKVPFSNQKKLSQFRRDNIGFIVQNFALIEDCSVFYNVSLPLKYRGISNKEINKKTNQVLKELGLLDKSNALPSELSGGQKQRVAIARAIVNSPAVLLADEPTGSLDTQTSKEIMSILKKLNLNKTTIIIVTHDNSIAEQCDRIIYMEDGLLV